MTETYFQTVLCQYLIIDKTTSKVVDELEADCANCAGRIAAERGYTSPKYGIAVPTSIEIDRNSKCLNEMSESELAADFMKNRKETLQ